MGLVVLIAVIAALRSGDPTHPHRRYFHAGSWRSRVSIMHQCFSPSLPHFGGREPNSVASQRVAQDQGSGVNPATTR
jgi:hypothetical protein